MKSKRANSAVGTVGDGRNRAPIGPGPVQNILAAATLLSPLALGVVALALGVYQISVFDVVRSLLSPVIPDAAIDVPEIPRRLVLYVRLPRVLAALAIGAGLGVTGTVFQGIFTNPLVDSGLLGVTAGAGFGAAVVMLLGGGAAMIQLGAFGFGLLAVAIAFLGARRHASAPKIVLTLMGILVGSFFASLTSLLKYLADPLDTLPAITFWLMGGLTGVSWERIPFLLAVTSVGIAVFVLVRWRLNVLSLGDAEARALGMNPERMKLVLIAVATLVAAAAVSVGGVIGWVGLVTPHAARMLVGPDHSRLVPMATALGAAFLVAIDTVSRSVLSAELPLGVLTGIIGVPLLVLLLRRQGVGW